MILGVSVGAAMGQEWDKWDNWDNWDKPDKDEVKKRKPPECRFRHSGGFVSQGPS